MKKLLILMNLLSPLIVQAASTVANPFKIRFTIPKDKIAVEADLFLSCRHEKFSIGDTAEYESYHADYKLNVRYEDKDEFTQKVTVYLGEKKQLYINGIFKIRKECTSRVAIDFKDRKYSVGWAGKYDTPISFTLTTDYYNYSEDNILDVTYLEDILNDNHVSFYYRSVPSVQVNVWLYVNHKELYEVAPTSAAIDGNTNKPYLLVPKIN